MDESAARAKGLRYLMQKEKEKMSYKGPRRLSNAWNSQKCNNTTLAMM